MQTVLTQFAVSALLLMVLGAWALSANSKHPAPASEIEMLSIFTFAEKNFGSFLDSGPEELTADWFIKSHGKSPNKESSSPYGRVERFLELRRLLVKEGHVSVDDIGADTSLGQGITVAIITALSMFIISPFYCYARGYRWEEDREVRAFPIVHTAERGVNLLQEYFVAMFLLLQAANTIYYHSGWYLIVGLTMVAPGFCFELYKIVRILSWQAKWKDFWGKVFLQV